MLAVSTLGVVLNVGYECHSYQSGISAPVKAWTWAARSVAWYVDVQTVPLVLARSHGIIACAHASVACPMVTLVSEPVYPESKPSVYAAVDVHGLSFCSSRKTPASAGRDAKDRWEAWMAPMM